MAPLSELFVKADTLTFDCYGTLIDWSAGLRSALGRIFGEAAGRDATLIDAYVETEAEVEAGEHRLYREVLAETVRRLASCLQVDLPPGREDWLAEALPAWTPFADTNEALRRLKRRFRLGVLSNVDRDLFSGTARHFAVDFDFVITAEDVGSYKPAPGHFQRLIESHAPAETVVHVGQSPYHDGVPAEAFGLPFVWINRYAQENRTGVRPDLEFPDLRSLADAACPAGGARR